MGTFSIFLQLFLLGLAGANFTGKCCKPNEILSLNSRNELVCVPSKDVHRQLYDAKNRTKGLPMCVEPKYITTSIIEDAASIANPACIEIISQNLTEEGFPAVVSCKFGSDAFVKVDVDVNRVKSGKPSIFKVRRCCSADKVYDVKKKYCVSSDDDGTSVMTRVFDDVDFIEILTGPPNCQFAIVDYEIDISEVSWQENEQQIVIPWKDRSRNISVNEFNACFNSVATSNSIVVRVCSDSEYCKNNVCVRKCCPEGFLNPACDPTPEPLSVVDFRKGFVQALKDNWNETSVGTFNVESYGLLTGRPCTDGMYKLSPSESWSIFSNGDIFMPSENAYYTSDNSCMEILYNNEDYEDGFSPFFCFSSPIITEDEPDARFYITGALALTSSFFLLLTFSVYLCLPTLQNLHGKTLMCHVASLFMAYVCLAITSLVTQWVPDDLLCECLGYAQLFSFLSAFLWLNVLCFDIWWTFGGLHRAARSYAKAREKRNKFLVYCLYAWGSAFALTSVTAVFQHVDVLPHNYTPKIGLQRCWFSKGMNHSELIFFVLPVSVVLIINTVFFIRTAHHCSKVKAEIKHLMAGPADPKTKKYNSDRNKYILNLKLFIVMGITWFFETSSSLMSHYQPTFTWLHHIFYVMDVINCLQGLLIFILFVLKRKVFLALRRRLAPKSTRDSSNVTNVRDPYKVTKTASNSTLMSTFAVNSAL